MNYVRKLIPVLGPLLLLALFAVCFDVSCKIEPAKWTHRKTPSLELTHD